MQTKQILSYCGRISSRLVIGCLFSTIFNIQSFFRHFLGCIRHLFVIYSSFFRHLLGCIRHLYVIFSSFIRHVQSFFVIIQVPSWRHLFNIFCHYLLTKLIAKLYISAVTAPSLNKDLQHRVEVVYRVLKQPSVAAVHLNLSTTILYIYLYTHIYSVWKYTRSYYLQIPNLEAM